MKLIKIFPLLYVLVAMALILATAGCATQKNEKEEKESTGSQMLVVERQTTHLSNGFKPDPDFYTHSLDVTIDAPLDGPQPLMDSLKVFLNKELHDAFSFTVGTDKLTEKELFQDNMRGMLSYYSDKYKQYQENIFNDYSLTLLVVAQTESFITYGLEFCHCGANCGAEFYCYTFSKQDGHRCELIDQDNLTSFIKEHCSIQKEYKDLTPDRFSLGLLEDRILIAEQEASNHHYVASVVDLQEVLPYLSRDARELIDSKGNSAEYSFEKWSLGKRMGKVETVEGDTAILMQPVSWWGFLEGENEELVNEKSVDEKHLEVTAYKIIDGRYVPSEIKTKSRVIIGTTKDYMIRLDIDLEGKSQRYSSWNHDDITSPEPDLIIDATDCGILGYGDQIDCGYSFENKGYRYEVWTALHHDGPQLLVYEGEKLLLRQPMHILFSSQND